MRRKDREIKDFNNMLEILSACDCCRLGLIDNGLAYIVPLNFGYKETNGRLELFFHGAAEGKKIELIKAQNTVSFEMDRKHQLLVGESPCSYSYLYQSIMGEGEIKLLNDFEEKTQGMDVIMSRFSDEQSWEYPRGMIEKMEVIKLAVTKWSCKENK
ncbi:MAG: pyridoxamine 5'-phosphate oxidase family protein [Tissierellia bacterium]|nr:pyridoxamine 5'-phosphate oxidase family protein [Tissierellia bacterium]